MDNGPLIASWILEFLIRQPLDDCVLNSLLRALPLPSDSPNLQKSLLLKKLDSEVSHHSLSESTLELLEQLEEIEFRRGNEALSDAMKRAYCAVAVDCTLKVLIEGDDEERSFKFFKIVRRLWRGRIAIMKKSVGKGGLGSEPLWSWQSEIVAAAWDDSVCERLINKFEEVQAEAAVRMYLREEREKMGPSFLELLAQRVKSDDGLLKFVGVNGSNNVNKEVHRNKHVGRRGARVNSLPSNVEAVEPSSIELRAAGEDPIPAEPLRAIRAIHSAEYNNGGPKLVIMDVAGVAQIQSSHDLPKPSFMQRNGSVCKYEWDDSIDNSSEDKGSGAVLQLYTPKRMCTAPLTIYGSNNMKKRRKSRKWSLEEEDNLRARVAQFGRGNWKAILNAHGDEFQGRTEVDLKDKWRNLTRH